MIKLELKDYCQTCPNFHFTVRKESAWPRDEVPTFRIGCEYETFCENISRHLDKKKKGYETNERKTD